MDFLDISVFLLLCIRKAKKREAAKGIMHHTRFACRAQKALGGRFEQRSTHVFCCRWRQCSFWLWGDSETGVQSLCGCDVLLVLLLHVLFFARMGGTSTGYGNAQGATDKPNVMCLWLVNSGGWLGERAEKKKEKGVDFFGLCLCLLLLGSTCGLTTGGQNSFQRERRLLRCHLHSASVSNQNRC